jgi:hypothetical protein
MKWLEIPAHGCLEVERHELTNEFDIYDEAARSYATAGHRTYFFVKGTARGSSSPSSVILKARPEEIALICSLNRYSSATGRS